MNDRVITLAHGSGGRATRRLIEEIILNKFNNVFLQALDDSALLKLNSKDIAFTTDSYVIDPIEFSGGDIGKLAVCGTLNDLAVCAARPLYISAGLIAEEGLKFEILERIIASMAKEAIKNKVKIVAGDFKVVPRGKADKIFINTSGIGVILKTLNRSLIRPGDKILINGEIGQHGLSILLAREKFAFKGKISSDCASVWPLVKNLLDANIDIHFMRDPTRAGVSAALNEIIEGNRFSIFLDEKTLPVDNNCNIFAEILGLDVLDVANEGKALLFVAPKDAGKALKIMRKSSLGKKAAIIGEVKTDNRLLAGKVYLKTKIKGLRLVDMPQDEPTPRIC